MSSTASSPRTSASSRTPTSPNRCSASAACRSIARSAKARASPCAASARTTTSSCSTGARCPRRATPAARAFPTRARSTSPTSRPKRFRRSRSTRPAARTHRPAASARRSTSRPRVRWTVDPVANIGIKAVNDTSNGNLPDSLQGDDFTPEISGIWSQTFADGRFGVAVTGSYQERDFGYSQVVGAQRLAPLPRRRKQLGHDPAAGHARFGEHHQSPRCHRHLLGAAEPELQRQRRAAPAHQRPGRVPVGADRRHHHDARLHVLRKQDPAAAQRVVGVVQLRSFGDLLDRWSGGRADHLFRNDQPGDQRPLDGRHAAGQRQREQVARLQCRVGSERRVRPGAGLPRLLRRNASRQPVGFGGRARCRRIRARHDDRRFQQRLPRAHRRVAAGCRRGCALAGTGHRFGVPERGTRESDIKQLQLSGRAEFAEASGLDFGVSQTEVEQPHRVRLHAARHMGRRRHAGRLRRQHLVPGQHGELLRHVLRFERPALHRPVPAVRFRTPAPARRGNHRAPRLVPGAVRSSRATCAPRRNPPARYVQYTHVRLADAARRRGRRALRESTEVTLVGAGAGRHGHRVGRRERTQSRLRRPGLRHDPGQVRLLAAQPRPDLARHATTSSCAAATARPSAGRAGRTSRADARSTRSCASTAAPVPRAIRTSSRCCRTTSTCRPSGTSPNRATSRSATSARTSRTTSAPNRSSTSAAATARRRSTCTRRSAARTGTRRSASGCATTDVVCIRNYIFANFDGQPGVDADRHRCNGNTTGTITGLADRSAGQLPHHTPANTEDSTLDGWEFNLQYVFGDSGFGVATNYTIVDSPNLNYNNYLLGGQFALVGLSDSANLVVFYENYDWSVRAAYNWRDEFLSGRVRRFGHSESQLHRGLRPARPEHRATSSTITCRSSSRPSTSPTRRIRVSRPQRAQLLVRDPERRRATCSACATILTVELKSGKIS